MVKRRSEDDGRLLRDLRDGAANDQTHLLEGGDVRNGTSETPGPAELANTGPAGMAARLAAAAATADC